MTKTEKEFLNRVSMRLYGSRSAWRKMMKKGWPITVNGFTRQYYPSIDEVTERLVMDTKDRQQQELEKGLREARANIKLVEGEYEDDEHKGAKRAGTSDLQQEP